MSEQAALIQQIHQRSAKVVVIGAGYVGLPLAVEWATVGFQVVTLDVDERKVTTLNRGESYIEDVSVSTLRTLVQSGRLRASSDYSELQDAQVISICVPTPIDANQDPDMGFVLKALDGIERYIHNRVFVSLESTVYPGATEELIVPRLAAKGFTVGEDIFIAFSPERIDPGNAQFGVRNTPKIIGGATPACNAVAQAIYGTIIEKLVTVSSPRTAEMSKLLENTFRLVNISLVNELAVMAHHLQLDLWESIQAAATKPFGFMPFYPGPGAGGHCIPVDPHYLRWKMRTYHLNTRFIELAAEVNNQMPHVVVERVMDALNDDGKALRGAKVAVLGVAYKPNIADPRESPSIEVVELLLRKGAALEYHDPYIPQLTSGGHTLTSCDLTDAWLAQADCVVILTHHRSINWEQVVAQSRLVVDTRHVTTAQSNGARIVRL